MIGSTISHYNVVEELGRGGMGVVYKAFDSKLDRTVALKFLPPEKTLSEKNRTRLVSEARAASALNHPNILTIHDIDEIDEQLYIVMEYLDGRTLHDRISEGPLTIPEIAEIAHQIAVGLRVAHDSNIIHRDIKPGNLMLVGQDRLKIMDFGLAKKTGGESLTEEGQTVGTAGYMSPEQIRGEKVDKRTDIWSFGIVLYEMLTGERPFQGQYLPAVIYSVLNEDPSFPDSDDANDAEPLYRIVGRCLEKNRDDRYADMGEILTDLDAFISSAGITISSVMRAEYGRTSRSYKFVFAGMAVVITVLFVMAFPTILQVLFGFELGSEQPLRIAVLPFESIGGEKFDQSVSDGLLHSLTSQLFGLQRFDNRLSVIPTVEVLSKGIRDVTQADLTFDVDLVITSTITRVGDRVTLVMSLIDATMISIENTMTLEASASNLLAFQNDATPALLSLLGIDVSGMGDSDEVIGGTTVPEAYSLYLQGQGYLQRFSIESNVDEAIRLFDEAIQADPRYALAHAGLGDAYWQKYEITRENSWVDEANASAHLALGINDGLAPVHLTLGLIYTNRGNHEEGNAAYARALELEPNNVAALIGLGDSYSTQKRDVEAEEYYNRAIELRPTYWLSYNRLGILYYLRDRFDEAIEQFRHVTELAPERWRGFNNLSSSYGKLGRPIDQIRSLEQAIILEPENAMPFRNLASLYYLETSDYARAARTLESAVKLGENDYKTWSQLANAYYWAPGERSKATNAWNKTLETVHNALQVNPTDRTALDYRAAALSSLGKFEEALASIQSILEFGDFNAQNYRTIAQIYVQQGDRDSALVYIRLAFEERLEPRILLNTPWFTDLRTDARFAEISAEFVSQE